MYPFINEIYPDEIDMPITMFNDGSMMVHTPNQAECFECEKAPHVVRSMLMEIYQ